MFGKIPHKTKQFFFVLIKLSIVVGAFYFIYNKLTSNPDLNFQDFVNYLAEANQFSLKTISFLIILSFLNWFFEILKWQALASSLKKISFYKAMEQSLSSLTASLLTPNRIGEYGVKAMYYSPPERKRMVALNLLGNGLQMLVTVLLGSVGLYLFLNEYETDINYHKIARFGVIILFIAVVGYIAISKSQVLFKGFSIQKITNYFRQLPFKIYSIVFIFAVIRYAIFSFQFYYILTLFGVSASYYNALIIITSMYFLASVIPSLFIFDVIIKGSVAVYLFAIVGVNAFTVLSTVTIMWLLNVVIPSVFGSIFVLKFKLHKS
ncbi:Lysylphosphatidylglycerol synthase TM region [Bizionia echini]|uniref:Lysylphosphatidylglycerol synthase TM region n=1 Tax=Bizionia echini TaxID=649333 RepID=A0A1I4YT50_9FLAO|nr:lysylphosphatidylglycerol synthase domain-containing protein [Bizionia echini]SFN41205.1 Lysylphosphatidylglycerol synthase TM region [Bizionia echini]